MKNNLILNKKQDEFHLILSRFSHEIRNPIALINSEIQMIEDTHLKLSHLITGMILQLIWSIPKNC